jgi:hypothetical protein
MLEGVSDVFRFFRGSRLASVALLTSTVVLSFGQSYSSAVPTVPSDWRWLLWAVMIFTGLQCAYWALEAIFGVCVEAGRALRDGMFPVKLQELSGAEQFVLAIASAHNGYFFEENAAQYSPRPEAIAVSLAQQSLVRRGLMESSFSGSYLTENGKIFCLANDLSKRVNRAPETPGW